MDALADSNWLIKLHHEFRRDIDGPGKRVLASRAVYYNPIAQAEFLSVREGVAARRLLLARLRKVAGGTTYEDADRAAQMRRDARKRGRTLHTPDALVAACAVREKMQLLTADKDFSGIPGLSWAKYG